MKKPVVIGLAIAGIVGVGLIVKKIVEADELCFEDDFFCRAED